MKTAYKEINYAYPSSTTAVRLGKKNEGCWNIQTSQPKQGTKLVRIAFTSKNEAYRYAINELAAIPFSVCTIINALSAYYRD